MSTPRKSTEPSRAEHLAAVVANVPGVDQLYPATPVLVGLVKEIVGTLSQKPAAAEMVSVTDSRAGLTASVSIGIGATESATEVCRRVYDAIEAHLAAAGDPVVAGINVTVARIG